MTGISDMMPSQFKSSGELELLLFANAKRNALAAAVGSVLAIFICFAFGYSLLSSIAEVLMLITLMLILYKINVSNFRVLERIIFVLATFMIVGLMFETKIVTTIVVFLPCFAYLFLVEGRMIVRWGMVMVIVVTVLISCSWFFPNLTLGNSSYDLRYEAMFDVLLAAIFTGVFVRFHMEFKQLSVRSSEQQAASHAQYVAASKIAYDSLALQKADLDKMYEASRVALLNDRLAYAQIAASQDQLEQFAYAASHDLKEPIRTIRSFLQVVRRRLPDALIEEEGLEEHFEFVEQSSESMHTLLERLLIYSRIDRVSQSSKLVGIVGVLQRLCSSQELGLAKVGANVSVDLPDEMSEVQIFINPDHGLTIFRELLCNAVLFRSENRTLEIHIEVDIVDEDNVLVTFSDNGIGIEDEYHEQVFGLFKRLNAREAYPGSGLGLSLVRSITEAAYGEVSLSSVMGKGTQVHLLLPRKAQEIPEEETEE